MNCAHTGEEIAAAIERAIDESGIGKDKVHLVIRDAASSMKKACRLMGVESWDCFLHKVNLSVEEGVRVAGVSEAISKAKSIAQFFNSSSHTVEVST